MNFDLNAWIGQVTTGHGAMILGPTLLAAASGTMSWQTAVPFLAAGCIGLVWPENTTLQSAARSVATDVEALITAYRTGIDHGAAVQAPEAVAAATAPASHGGTAAAVVATLVAAGLALSACANQIPAQQTATETGIATGLLCLATAGGQIIATASTNDPNAVKAVNAAIAAGDVLLTDAACKAAITNAAAVVPHIGAVQQ